MATPGCIELYADDYADNYSEECPSIAPSPGCIELYADGYADGYSEFCPPQTPGGGGWTGGMPSTGAGRRQNREWPLDRILTLLTAIASSGALDE